MSLSMPESRGSSISLIGAISNEGILHHQLIDGSNNQRVFAVFIRELLRKADPEATVVMDNLSVHKALTVKSLFKNGQQ